MFTETAWQDYLWFQEKDRQLSKRINLLIKETLRTPFEGLGKPEALKADLSGYWSRREEPPALRARIVRVFCIVTAGAKVTDEGADATPAP